VGALIGPQIRHLLKDPRFDLVLNSDGNAAWNAFRHVATGFIGNVKAANFRTLLEMFKFLRQARLQHVTQDVFPPFML
jgi:hypothetical protein